MIRNYFSSVCAHTICYGATECVIHAGRPAPVGLACCSSSIGPACQHRTDPKGWTREKYLATTYGTERGEA